jgi:enoyl-CoA hydratase
LDFVNVERGEDGVSVLTVDRQDKLNSLNQQVLEEIREALLGLEDDPPRVSIVTGAGERAFVAGADISAMM